MAKTPGNVKIGTCDVFFNAEDLGYTKGGCSVEYSTESVEVTVDQEDSPITELITKQVFQIKAPLAEYDLERLADLIPGAVFSGDATKKKLVLSGAAGGDLLASAKELILKPKGGTANDWITIHHAIPLPNISFAFEKENQRVFEVTFKAMKGASGFVTFGDVTAV